MGQAINYNNITNTIIGFLNSVNTTTATYDLSLGLDSRVVDVVRDDLYVMPKMKPMYPLVNVRLESKSETFTDFNINKLGRAITLNYSLFLIYNALKDADASLLTMLRNVEANIRSFIAAGDYIQDMKVLYLLPSAWSYVDIGPEDNFNKSILLAVTVFGYLDGQRWLFLDQDEFGNYYADN